MSWDPYLDLRTGVLRNRLDINSPEDLARAEADLSALRIAQLSRRPLPGNYDLPHLQAFHRHIFGDVYDWAGQLRTVRMGKGGALFCLPEELPHSAAAIFARLAEQDYLRGLAWAEFVDRLAELLSDINQLHPFREGNGRTQRAFLTQLARDAGWRTDWTQADQDTNVSASRAARAGDLGPLREMVASLVGREPPSQAPLPRDPGVPPSR